MKNIALVLCTALLLLGAGSCKNNPVEPPDDENVTPGRRDYIWTSDTLYIPFTSFSQLWGDALDNVWAVGPGGGLDKTIWRYDGSKWSTDGISRAIAPECIFGFGKNDIWAGGNFGSIWHFNGSTWSKMYQITIPAQAATITGIYGDSSNDLYAVGFVMTNNISRGFIYHYNGSYWAQIFLGTNNNQFTRIAKGKNESDKYYILAMTVGPPDSSSIYEFNGNNLKMIKTSIWNNTNVSSFRSFYDKMYFIFGDGIYKYWDNNFISIVKVPDPSNFAHGIMARSSKDILLLMLDGVQHYNGSNLEYLFRSTPTRRLYLRGGVILQDDVFLLEVPYQGLNVIHHGKLRNTGGIKS